MIKKLAFTLALVIALAGNAFATASQGGPNDCSEAFGGTRTGGQC